MPVVMPASELQRNFKTVLDRCEQSKQPIYLTRKGASALVVIDAETFDREMALHYEVQDREIRVQKAIARGLEDFEAGNYRPLADALRYADSARGARNGA